MRKIISVLFLIALFGCNSNSDDGGQSAASNGNPFANIETPVTPPAIQLAPVVDPVATTTVTGAPVSTVAKTITPSTPVSEVTVQDILNQIKFETYRVYAQSPFDENTDRVEWAPCKPDSQIISGGCDCGNSVTMLSYQIYNAQFCKCGSWTYRMLAYAVCFKGPGISSHNYFTEQNQEADRLAIGGTTGNGSQNTMHLEGGILFTPWDYKYSQ